MDRLTNDICKVSPWNTMVADDTVFCSKSNEKVQTSLEKCRIDLEIREMKIIRRVFGFKCEVV